MTLPADFPAQINVAFQQGEHKGKPQLWAPFEHKGKRYKLVMSGGAYPQAGDTRTVYPFNSPNGHIVFCHLYPSRDEDYHEEDLWSNHDDFDHDAYRERQEELYWERLEREY